MSKSLRNPRASFLAPLRGSLLALVLLCASVAAAATPLPDWQSPLLRDHPLTGRIWDPAAEAFLSAEQVSRRLAATDVLLLGERHDNADHHRLQAWMVSAMVAVGHRPAVAFEMIPRDLGDRLRGYLEQGGTAAGLGEALDWQDSGWPDWSIYQPIAEVALENGLDIVAADLPLAKRRQISETGAGGLPDGLRRLWALERPWPEEMTQSLLEELSRAHCDVAPPEAFARQAEVQRARDAAMADSLLQTVERGDTAVLIAGAGHTRPDRGVPWFLAARLPDLETLSVAFREVETGRTQPALYGDQGEHDLIWFTPRHDDVDPCEAFAEQLERLREAP